MEVVFLGERNDVIGGFGLLHDVQISGPLNVSNRHLHMLLQESHHSVDSRPTSCEYHDILGCDFGPVLGIVVLYNGFAQRWMPPSLGVESILPSDLDSRGQGRPSELLQWRCQWKSLRPRVRAFGAHETAKRVSERVQCLVDAHRGAIVRQKRLHLVCHDVLTITRLLRFSPPHSCHFQ